MLLHTPDLDLSSLSGVLAARIMHFVTGIDGALDFDFVLVAKHLITCNPPPPPKKKRIAIPEIGEGRVRGRGRAGKLVGRVKGICEGSRCSHQMEGC